MSDQEPKPEDAEANGAEAAAEFADTAPFESAPEGEPAGEAGDEIAAEQRIADLEAALAETQKERLLALAEAENAGKRADKRISDNAKYATSNICKALLQVADNMERALLAAPEEMRGSNEVVKNLAVGVEMTAKELATVLESQGVKKFESLEQPFDPNLHQAMQEVENPDVPSGTVVQVVQDGYMMADRLLRPAMVVVAKGGPKREAAPAQENGSHDPASAEGVDTSA